MKEEVQMKMDDIILEIILSNTSIRGIDLDCYRINFIPAVNEIQLLMEKMYNHAMMALCDTGHGEGFDEYCKNKIN